MPSAALAQWHTTRLGALDQIAAAHSAVGGHGRGRRYATLQINHAYAGMLSGQFQGFCRALHSAAVNVLIDASKAAPAPILALLSAAMIQGRKLDSGNPNAGNIGADFDRLGMSFWNDVYADDSRNRTRRQHLDTLNAWRNAIAHQDFTPKRLDGVRFIDFSGGTGKLRLGTVRAWRVSCAGLATSFDRVVGAHLAQLVGASPW